MHPVPSDFFLRVSVPTQPSFPASFLEASRLSDPVGEFGETGVDAIPSETTTFSLTRFSQQRFLPVRNKTCFDWLTICQ